MLITNVTPTNSAHCISWGLPDLPETIKKSLTFNDIDNVQDFPKPFLNIFLGFPDQKITFFWDSYLSLTTLLVFHRWQLLFKLQFYYLILCSRFLFNAYNYYTSKWFKYFCTIFMYIKWPVSFLKMKKIIDDQF